MQKIFEKAGWGLVIIPIVVFFYITIAYTSNLPFNDDYPTILDFLDVQSRTSGLAQKVKDFLAPYGEHRVFFIRFFSTIQYKLFGHLNFTWLTLIGNLGFLGFFIVLIKSLKAETKTPLIIACVAFLLFQLQTWSNFTWAMTSLSNTLILFWVALSFYFLYQQKTWQITLGIFFGLFATYSNGNGIFVFAIAAVILAFRKNYKLAGLLLALFVVFFKINNSANGAGMLSKISKQPLHDIIGKFFVFLGSNVFHPSYWYVALVLGVALLLYFIWVFFIKKYYQLNPLFCSLFSFVFLTAIAVATQRENIDMLNAAPSRYRIYCTILLICTAISLVEISGISVRKKLVAALLPLSILFYAASTYVGIGKIKSRQELVAVQSFMIEHDMMLDSAINKTYNTALKTGVITASGITANAIKSTAVPSFSLIPSKDSLLFDIENCSKDAGHLLIKGWAGKNDNSNSLNKIFITLHSGNTASSYNTRYMDVMKFLNLRDSLKFANTGFFAAIPYNQKVDSISISLKRGFFAEGAEKITTFATPQL